MENRRKKKVLIISEILAIVLIILAGVFFYKLSNMKTKSPAITSNDRNDKWKADLKFLKKELPKKHKDLFFYKSKEEFNDEMNNLIDNISQYNDEEIKGELTKIIVSINDSHTSVDFGEYSVYPLKFFQFAEGVYLIDGAVEYKEYWGKKLVAVNGYNMEQVKEKLKPYLSKDNEAIFINQFTNALSIKDMLLFSGISDEDEEITYTFEEEEQVSPKPILLKELDNLEFISDSSLISKYPISRQNYYSNYWFKYLEDRNTIYVKYNVCSDMEGYSFEEFTKAVFNTLDKKDAENLIIDLRDNGGGNSSLFEPFLKAIKERSNINKEGKLYVIVGRKTFSSAILNAMDLKDQTNTILVGEATGGKPNHFGEIKNIYLSNTDIEVYYSSKYFKTTDEEVDSIYPDVEVPLRASSFFSGKDDFIEAIE